MLTPCQCPVAGYCETHQRQMTEGLHRACRERKGYYETFQRTLKEQGGQPKPAVSRGPTQSRRTGKPKASQKAEACVHGGEVVRSVRCRVCSRQSESRPVYRCGLYGECMDRANEHDLAACSRCDSFVARQPSGSAVHH